MSTETNDGGGSGGEFVFDGGNGALLGGNGLPERVAFAVDVGGVAGGGSGGPEALASGETLCETAGEIPIAF